MNVQLSPAQLAEINTITLTKRQKLLRLASLIRASKVSPLVMFSNIEYFHPEQLAFVSHPYSAFALAASDGILKDAGLASDSVLAAQRFFELTRDELHAFSCDCGGHISNETMANRVEFIAARSA